MAVSHICFSGTWQVCKLEGRTDLARRVSDLEMTWLFYCSGATTGGENTSNGICATSTSSWCSGDMFRLPIERTFSELFAVRNLTRALSFAVGPQTNTDLIN